MVWLKDFLYIGVHPYHPEYEIDATYVKKRNERILTPNIEQILILDERLIDKTRDALKLTDNYWETRILVTSDHLMFRGCDDSLISMQLKEEFPAKSYVFWGAELHMSEGDIRGGCVYHLFYRLNLPNKIIDQDTCFIRKV